MTRRLTSTRKRKVENPWWRGHQPFSYLMAVIRHPSIITITGVRGSGKSATAHLIAEHMHEKGHEVVMICPRSLYEKKILPKWMILTNYVRPHVGENRVILLDDAQLQFHAREWYKKRSIKLDKALSTSRHRKRTVIFTTQMASKIDANIVKSTDIWLFKKPPYDADEWERREIRRKIKNAVEAFDDVEDMGENPFEYCFLASDFDRALIGPYGLPSYWSEEISEW